MSEPECGYCLDQGFAPVPPGDSDPGGWGVCLCEAGKRWRYDRQGKVGGKTIKTVPLWKLWEAQNRGELQGKRVDVLENFYPPSVIRELFKL